MIKVAEKGSQPFIRDILNTFAQALLVQERHQASNVAVGVILRLVVVMSRFVVSPFTIRNV